VWPDSTIPLIDLEAADGVRIQAAMLPSTTWGSNVRGLLSGKQWDAIRLPVCAAARNRCEVCGRTGRRQDGRVHRPDCHEVWAFEVRDGRNVQRLARLIALCSACHSLQHMGRDAAQDRSERTIRTLCRVNHWSREQALADIRRSVRLYESMDHVEFDLDLTLLADRLDVPAYPSLYVPAAERYRLGNSHYKTPPLVTVELKGGPPPMRRTSASTTTPTGIELGVSDRTPSTPKASATAPLPATTDPVPEAPASPGLSEPQPTPSTAPAASTPHSRSRDLDLRDRAIGAIGWTFIGLGWLGVLLAFVAAFEPYVDPATRAGRVVLLLGLLTTAILATTFAGLRVKRAIARILWFVIAGLPALALQWWLAQHVTSLGHLTGPLYAIVLMMFPIGSWLCASAQLARSRRQAADYWAWMTDTAAAGTHRLAFVVHSAPGSTESRVLTRDLFDGSQRNETLWGYHPVGLWVLVTPQRTVTASVPDSWRRIHERRARART
jgi:hypothetical protein